MTDRRDDPTPQPALPDAVRSVMSTLRGAGFTPYLVGGCVRDTLLGRPVHDFDVASNATPDQVTALFTRTIPTGVQHGTVTVLDGGVPIEVTTFRVDQTYSDGRHPDAVLFTDRIVDDLARRDFTINAMALDESGNLVDPYGGQADLVLRQIRAVGRPFDRFAEDALRILRALRFSAQLGFHLEADTRAAMTACSRRLATVSRERVGQEMARIALGNWTLLLADFASGPILADLPGPWVKLQPGFARLRQNGFDDLAWHRLLASVRAGESEGALALSGGGAGAQGGDVVAPDAAQRQIAALACWCIASGCDRRDALRLGRTGAWPRPIREPAAAAVDAARDDPLQWPRQSWRRQLYDRDRQAVWLACCVLDHLESIADARRLHEFSRYAAEQPLWGLGDLAVSGRDLLSIGFVGRQVGQVLARLAAEVLSDALPNEPQALLDVCRRWHARLASDESQHQTGTVQRTGSDEE